MNESQVHSWKAFQRLLRGWDADPRNHNPLYEAYRALIREYLVNEHGQPWVDDPRYNEAVPLTTARYAYAVPTHEALEVVARYSPLVEMGAGTGYWASLLAERGVDIVCHDKFPPSGSARFFPVTPADPAVLADHGDRALFLCWPPHGLPFAADCLQAYPGETVVYIGERAGGACATDAFFTRLEAEFELASETTLPSWWGYHDQLYVWKRR